MLPLHYRMFFYWQHFLMSLTLFICDDFAIVFDEFNTSVFSNFTIFMPCVVVELRHKFRRVHTNQIIRGTQSI